MKTVSLNVILHVITTIELGGAEKQLLTLVERQVACGYLVHVVYLKGNPKLEGEFLKLGVTVSRARGKSPIVALGFLILYLKRNNIDLVHAHLPRAEIITALTFSKIPFVVSRHNAEPFFPTSPSFISRLLSSFVCKRANAVIAISNAVKSFLIDSREVKCSEKIKVVRYGLKSNLDTKETFLFKPTDKIMRILSIGRLVEQKDYPTTFKALAKLIHSNLDFHYSIIGDGNLQSSLKELSEDLGIANYISWVGKTSHVNKFFDESNVFILSSKYEGFGLVILEAMNRRIPILASCSPAMIEVLGHNYPGLFPIGDSFSLAKLLVRCREAKFLQLLVDQANKRLMLFNPDNMAKEIESIYRETLQ
jgi:glycosyltransferase involved in cell wall biosynthesis